MTQDVGIAGVLKEVLPMVREAAERVVRNCGVIASRFLLGCYFPGPLPSDFDARIDCIASWERRAAPKNITCTSTDCNGFRSRLNKLFGKIYPKSQAR